MRIFNRTGRKSFFFFYPHTLTFRLKRPVYRGFRGEGKCEGKCFYPHTYSHHPHTLTLPAGSIMLAEDSMDGRQIQWAGRE